MAASIGLLGPLHWGGSFLLAAEDMGVIPYNCCTETIFFKKPYFLGWINDFLCWGGFIPLSRISYIIYLMHFTVIWTFESVMIYPLDGTNTMMVL